MGFCVFGKGICICIYLGIFYGKFESSLWYFGVIESILCVCEKLKFVFKVFNLNVCVYVIIKEF